ncbi:ice-structuring glycoprotein-like [Anopheles arabiensis]|uniref:ice-structuring glycoprotein-like n=1 Tax=Anopheles arabiensis TaxID=7173 RepID=UPI001AAD1BA1|nr:ice-structuring glycoprotein-like [Anopheles arabiensis]
MERVEDAEAIVKEHRGKHSITHEEKHFPINIEMVDGAVDVSVRDLPHLIPDEEIVAEMAQYGEVLSVTKGVWAPDSPLAGALNGVRVLRMKLLKPILSYVTLCGEVTGVSYRGQAQTCRNCAAPVHHGLNCVQNRQNRFANVVQVKATYANTVSAKTVAPTPQAASHTAAGNSGQKKKKKSRSRFLSAATPAPTHANVEDQHPRDASKIAARLIIPIVPVTVRPSSPKPNSRKGKISNANDKHVAPALSIAPTRDAVVSAHDRRFDDASSPAVPAAPVATAALAATAFAATNAASVATAAPAAITAPAATAASTAAAPAAATAHAATASPVATAALAAGAPATVSTPMDKDDPAAAAAPATAEVPGAVVANPAATSAPLAFKVPLDVLPAPFPGPSTDEPRTVTRKRTTESDVESDASSSSMNSFTMVAKRKPGRPSKKATTTNNL